MADFTTQSKDGWGEVYKDNQVDTDWQDYEPLITPDQLRTRHLYGIPLVSMIRNPLTGKPDIFDDPRLSDMILESVSLAELESGLDIFPRQYEERQGYDQCTMQTFGYMKVRHFPASSIQELAVVSSDGIAVWSVPTAWIETGYLHQGQINLLPFAVAAQSGTTVPVVGPVGLGLLPALFKFNWVPALWRVRYCTGFPKGRLPKTVNQLIGVTAAMEVLSMLAATHRNNSSSLGLDGLSQSQSTPGPQVYVQRMQELAAKRKWLIAKLRHNMGIGIIVGEV